MIGATCVLSIVGLVAAMRPRTNSEKANEVSAQKQWRENISNKDLGKNFELIGSILDFELDPSIGKVSSMSSIVNSAFNTPENNRKLWSRVWLARRSWGGSARNFVVQVGPESVAALPSHGCTFVERRISQRSRHSFDEWQCTGVEFETFDVLVTNCSEGYLDYSENFCCKHDRAVEYIFYVRPEKFSESQWFTVGDDDMGFNYPVLLDFLHHYNASDSILVNPAARTIQDQRSAAGPSWNHAVRKCNPNMPQRFMGSVYSRGLFTQFAPEHSEGAFQHLCKQFNAAQDTMMGQLYWTKAAKFLPLGQYMPDTSDVKDWSKRGNPNDILMAHRMREPEAFKAMEDELSVRFPHPEELSGPRYVDTVNAKHGGTVFTLTPDTCQPEHRPHQSISSGGVDTSK